MNCCGCREQMLAYVEGRLAPSRRREVTDHLNGCPGCRFEFEQGVRIHERLIRDAAALPRPALDQPVMERVFREKTPDLRRTAMRKRYSSVGLGLGAAAALIALLFVPWGSRHGGEATAAEVMTRGATAMAGLDSVHLKIEARTLPRDNFEVIGLDYDFVPIELWKRFGDPPRWRAELPGRVVVMDGARTVGLIRPNHAYELGPSPSFRAWVGRLMDADRVLSGELRRAEALGWPSSVEKVVGSDGRAKWVVTIEAGAQGDFDNDWLRNRSITGADTRRRYRFDAQTGLLEAIRVWVHDGRRDVLVLACDEIEYNTDPDPDLFTLRLPDDVIWSTEPATLPDNAKYARMTPDEVARAFFQALADRDWDEARKFYCVSQIDPRLKLALGGLRIIHVGEPFRSGRYPGWFVPYEIELPGGRVKKHNLALRNDNAAHRYVVDGGF